MRVADIIGSRTTVYSLDQDSTVHDAAQYLRERQVRAAGVLDADKRLVGVISQSDICDKVAAENRCPAWVRVREIMTASDLVKVSPDMTADACLRLMEQNGIYHLLVEDGSGSFMGMLSVSDLLRVIANDEKVRADLLTAMVFESR